MTADRSITGKLVEVEFDVAIEKKGGGTYQGYRVTYKNAEGEYKSFAKPIQSLKYNAALAESLKGLSPGDTFTIEMVKKDGFLNPTKAYKGPSQVQVTPAASQSSATQQQAQASGQRNTFEVNNELKEKQMKFDEMRQPIYVRQTALKAASELATVLGLKTEQDVMSQAKRFVVYIETGDTGSIEDMPNDDIDIE